MSKVKENTDRPWGVNIPLMRPDAEDIIKIGLDAGVKIFSTSAGNPMKAAPLIKRDNAIMIQVVPSVKGARKAQEAGCDIVVCEGYEAGGHNGMDETGTISLTPTSAAPKNLAHLTTDRPMMPAPTTNTLAPVAGCATRQAFNPTAIGSMVAASISVTSSGNLIAISAMQVEYCA